MTLGFNLVLALFLLTPGFAVVAGIHFKSQLSRVKSPPPAQASVLTLGLISIGAMVMHGIGAGVYALQDRFCLPDRCISVSFDPNVYAAFAHVPQTPLNGTQVFQLIATLLAVSAAGFWGSGVAIEISNRKRGLDGALYGWLADMATADSESEAILAYLISDIEDGGTVLGYEGIVENMTVTADREISTILLKSCESFYLRLDAKGVARKKIPRTVPIPQLYFEKSNIRNIAFERVRFE